MKQFGVEKVTRCGKCKKVQAEGERFRSTPTKWLCDKCHKEEEVK